VSDRDTKGVSSMFKVIRSPAVLTRMLPILDLSVRRTPRDGSGTGHGHVTETEIIQSPLH
jgi:hypothetical protein